MTLLYVLGASIAGGLLAVLVAAVAIPARTVSSVVLVGRHCHREDCDVHATSGPLLFVGDAVHNFVDGVVLAGAFVASPSLGLAATVSTVAHEVPQEIGEFTVYIRAGYSRRRALALNCATSLTTVAGGLLGYFSLKARRVSDRTSSPSPPPDSSTWPSRTSSRSSVTRRVSARPFSTSSWWRRGSP